jgi:hypothetical protein
MSVKSSNSLRIDSVRFDMINITLNVDSMEIDLFPKPINFVALLQAAVNEGFAQIALDTLVTESTHLLQALDFLEVKR